MLARITQILGAAQINLEDFELRHVSPEYGGVLVILVAGADNASKARELLRREGCRSQGLWRYGESGSGPCLIPTSPRW